MRVISSDDEVGDIMDPSEILDNPDVLNSSMEFDMALFKKSEKATAEKPAAEKPVKVPKPKAEKPAAEGRKFGPRQVPEGFVGPHTLAKEFNLKPAAVRRKLRTTEGIVKPEGQPGWYWKDGSRELNNIRKALAPKA